MNKNSVRALALSAAAVLAFGVSAPATFAKPATDHGAAAGHGKGHAETAHGKAAHADRTNSTHKLAVAGKQLDKLSARLDRALTRVVRDQRLHGIDATSAATLKTNAAADQAELDQAVAAAKAAPAAGSGVGEALATLRSARPEGYLIVENQLRRVSKLQAQLTAAAPAPTGTASTATTVADPSATLTDVVAKALAWSAFDGKAPLVEIRAELNSVEDALAPDDETDPADETGDQTDTGDVTPPAPTTTTDAPTA